MRTLAQTEIDRLKARIQAEIEGFENIVYMRNAEIDRLKAENNILANKLCEIVVDGGMALACSAEVKRYVDRLRAEVEGYANGQAQLQSICDGLKDSISKYASERKRYREAFGGLEEKSDTQSPK